jgi:spoIIIJ-associated protein
MEWVEITARTIEEARDEALDRLGIDEQDAEVEVLEEPRPGLFGRLRGQARIRVRVRPTAPRPKVERRDRRRRSGGGGRGNGGADSSEQTVERDAAVATATRDGEGGGSRPGGRRRGGRGRGAAGGARGEDRGGARAEEDQDMPELSIDEQAATVATFLTGLAEAFGAPGTSTSIERVEEDTIEIRLDGEDLGLLIGPKGQTLQTVQELARTVVQRRGGGTQEGRVRIDIAGYRKRRREALERFARQVADAVLATGEQKALEPMNAADRKVVHDTVNDIEGVRTVSHGEEPRRWVVLLPEG